MKDISQVSLCCGPGCKTPVHTESGEGFISTRYHKPFCSFDCEDAFDPEVYKLEHPTVPEVRKTRKEHFDAKDVFPTLYGPHREEAAQDSDGGRDIITQQTEQEVLVEPAPQDFRAFFAEIRRGLPTEPIYILH